MRAVSPTLLAYLQARRGLSLRVLLWAVPRNRATGLPEVIGLWNGNDDRDFVIGGQTRTYHGVGGLIGVDPIVSALGTDIRNQKVSLSPLNTDVIDLIRGYDPKLAPAEIHRACFDTDSRALVEEPHRLFKGVIERVRVARSAQGEESRCDITLASTARGLTRTLTARKSDASQRKRSDDRFRRYADVSGNGTIFWGPNA